MSYPPWMAKRVLHLTVSGQHPFVHRCRNACIAQLGLELAHLALKGEQIFEGGLGFREQRMPRVDQAILRQVPNGQIGQVCDHTAVRFVEPGEHPQERSFPGTVRAAEPDPISRPALAT